MATMTFSTSKRFALLLILVLLTCSIPVSVLAQGTPSEVKTEPKTELTEVQKLKVENHKLQIQVAQLKANLFDASLKEESARLSTEQVSLEKELRNSLKPKETDVFNWDTLKFEAKDAKPESKKDEKAPVPPVVK